MTRTYCAANQNHKKMIRDNALNSCFSQSQDVISSCMHHVYAWETERVAADVHADLHLTGIWVSHMVTLIIPAIHSTSSPHLPPAPVVYTLGFVM